MKDRTSHRLAARTVAAVLSVGALAIPAQTALAAPPPDAASPTPVTVADLADSSSAQQRWISEPDSRIALNPSHSQTDDARPKADNGLDTMFYANQSKRTTDGVVRNTFTQGEAPTSVPPVYDEGDAAPLLSETFGEGTSSRWRSTNNGGTISATAQGGVVTPALGTDWGAVGRDLTLDVDTDAVLLVSVAAAAKWALKIAPEGKGDIVVQGDVTATGTFAYDLKALGIPSGKATIKLFASGNGAATFRAVSVHARPALVDDFSDLSVWRTNVQSNNGATIARAASGLGATVSSSSPDGFGAVARTVTVDLSASPVLTLAVGPLSAGSQWALKLTGADGSGDFATIQNDTGQTGVFNYDLAALTGRTGVQTFGLKLFSTKTPTPTSATFTRISFHGSNSWTQAPTEATNTWNPQSLDWTGTYGEAGSYSTRDVFVDADTVSRLVSPADLHSGAPTLTGNFSDAAVWDSSSRALTVTDTRGGFTRAVGFPAGARVLFFDTLAAASLGAGGVSAPTSSSRTWLALLPTDRESAIGLGYAYGTGDAPARAATASAVAGTDTSAVRAALDSRMQEWNDYLSRVPVVKDFALHTVDAAGASPEAIRAIYYRAFVALAQTVVPPQPESGISHSQVATGKAATYNGGSARNRASASWDSLLGIQYLAYTEPDLAWDSLIGMLADVEDDGGLNGESLPSRKAQTAWMLYSVTGDAEKLAQVYPAVKAHMKWSSEHLAWNIDSHFPGGGVSASDERDAEFVNSLAIDLQYAAQSARVLGRDADAEGFTTLRNTLLAQYQEWFFMPDGKAVQYYWTSRPDATYDQRKGTVNYVGTGLHLPGLTDGETAAIMARFDEEYDPSQQFAGTASDALKAPDAQFIAYGLLEHGQTQKAQVYLEATLRDITRTHQFSEVYQAGKNGAEPISRGESPTTFGMAHVIDNLWILNGFRSDEGTPTFVRLPGAIGGVSGLSYLGRSLDVGIDGTQIALSGDAAQQPGVCERVDAPEGQSIALSTSCAPVTLSRTSVAGGEKVTLHASKLPSSAAVRVELHSDPILLGTATSTAEGTLDLEVTIPADVETGAHTVVVTSGDVSGQAGLAVTPAGTPGGNTGGTGGTPGTGGADGTGGANGTPVAPAGSNSSTGANGLASTGGDLLSTLLPGLIALTVLAAGVITLQISRRRTVTADATSGSSGTGSPEPRE